MSPLIFTSPKGAEGGSAASERQQLQDATAQAIAGFGLVHGQVNGLGHVNDGALVQVGGRGVTLMWACAYMNVCVRACVCECACVLALRVLAFICVRLWACACLYSSEACVLCMFQ